MRGLSLALGIWQLFPKLCLTSDQRDFVMNSSSGYTYNLCVEGVTDISFRLLCFQAQVCKASHQGNQESANLLHNCFSLGTLSGWLKAFRAALWIETSGLRTLKWERENLSFTSQGTFGQNTQPHWIIQYFISPTLFFFFLHAKL